MYSPYDTRAYVNPGNTDQMITNNRNKYLNSDGITDDIDFGHPDLDSSTIFENTNESID